MIPLIYFMLGCYEENEIEVSVGTELPAQRQQYLKLDTQEVCTFDNDTASCSTLDDLRDVITAEPDCYNLGNEDLRVYRSIVLERGKW